MSSPGTPTTLRMAIENGIKATHRPGWSPEFDQAGLMAIESHVLDFLRQKFGGAYLEAGDPVRDVPLSHPLFILQRLAKSIGVI